MDWEVAGHCGDFCGYWYDISVRAAGLIGVLNIAALGKADYSAEIRAATRSSS